MSPELVPSGEQDGYTSSTTSANRLTWPKAPKLSRVRTLAALGVAAFCKKIPGPALLLASAVLAQSSPSSSQEAIAPQIVEVPSGALHLNAYFWKPTGPGPFPAVLFNHGSGADDPQHTAGRTMAEAASDLAPVFLKHGYAFLYLCRRGQGLSADQGPFTQDLLKQAEAKGADARKQTHYQLITGSQLDDALAGLVFLKAARDVDPNRIAIVGHSFGGMVTLLSGDHDSTVRAEVAFAAGAKSWRASQQLRDRVLAAVDQTVAPIMLVYAANDFDTTPGKDISAELDRQQKSHLLKIYPAVGKTSEDGHSLLYLGIPEWERDVFQFLDDNVKQLQSPAPQTVEFPGRGVHLKAFLWKPAGPGPFPAVMFNHGRSNTPQQHTRKLTIAEPAQVLGPIFARHGYVFLCPFRRGRSFRGSGNFHRRRLAKRRDCERERRAESLAVAITDHRSS